MLYLDTSALAKLVFAERESGALMDFLDGRALAISWLSRSELRRVALRRSLPHMPLCDQLIGSCHEVAVTRELLDRAGRVEPAHLRSLDAIHLASASALADELDAFVGYDERLTEAAAQNGLPVATPS